MEWLGQMAFSHQLLVDLGVDSHGERLIILVVLDRNISFNSLRDNIVGTVVAINLFLLLLVLGNDSIANIDWFGGRVVHEIISLIILSDLVDFIGAFAFLTVRADRVFSLLLFVFIDSLKDSVHLLLEQELEFFDHKFVNRASFDEI